MKKITTNVEVPDTIVNAVIKGIEAKKEIIFKGMFDDIPSHDTIIESGINRGTGSKTYQNMGAIIIEAILQAGMNYERAVKPRVTKFLKEYPDTRSTSSFLELIRQRNFETVVNWRGEKILRITQLAEFLKMEGVETETALSVWLKDDQNAMRLKNIRGVKDKTVDYLKLLCGQEDTIAIDLHLMKFIKEHTNFDVKLSYSTARQILVSVAAKMHVKPAHLDYGIWKYMSQRAREKTLQPAAAKSADETVYCAKCSSPLDNKLYVFCPYCGEKLTSESRS